MRKSWRTAPDHTHRSCEPWTNNSYGKEGALLLSQNYGDEADWRKHFEFLLPYFKHQRYMKMEGKPLFAIYRPGHLGQKLGPMLRLWDSLATSNGFPGMYFVDTFNSFYAEGGNQHNHLNQRNQQFSWPFDAAYHCLLNANEKVNGTYAISTTSDQALVHEKVQFWGASTGFDNRVRLKQGATVHHTTPSEFYNALVQSFSAMAAHPKLRLPDYSKNLFVVSAWNKWNEQSILEPDAVDGFGYLNALRQALTGYRASEFKPKFG